MSTTWTEKINFFISDLDFVTALDVLKLTFPDLSEVAGAELPDEGDLGARDLVLVARGVLEGVVLGVGARLHPRRRPRQLAAQTLALGRRVAGHQVL